MGNQILSLKDKGQLLSALQESLKKKQTHKEILEQRISFVYSSLGHKSNVTRERVRELLEKQDGVTA